MNCPACGKEVDINSKYCTNCGAQLEVSPTIDNSALPPASSVFTSTEAAAPLAPLEASPTLDAAAPPQSNQVPAYQAAAPVSPDQDRIINSGSWGATLGIFYAAGMGAWGWFAGLLVSSFVYPVYLVLWIIFITKGKSIAWKNRKWDNFEQFLAVQRAWDLWGKILLAVQLLMIPAIIAAMVLVAVNGARAKARDANIKSDLRSIKSALVMYAADHENAYPNSLNVLVPDYIKELPKNPSTDQSYQYKKETANCTLSSPLENSADLDLSDDAVPTNGATYDLACE